MARKPRAKSTPVKSSQLLEALQFISGVTKSVGAPFETHALIRDNWVVGFNGVLSAGHKISEDISACPHTELMIEALAKSGDQFSITQLDNGRLSIKADKFKAVVPCVDADLMHTIVPDPPIAPVDDRFKNALEIVGVLASETAQHVVTASILMNGPSLLATDRHVLFEAWHGCDLPPNIPLPKAFVAPLTKTKKKLARFGFSQSSVTFYFDDDSWLKTQTWAADWPDMSRVLNKQCNPWPVPTDFFEAVKAVAPFSEDGNLYFESNLLKSHKGENVGASYEVSGLPAGPMFSAKQLLLLKDHVKTIDFLAPGPHEGTTMLMFYGDTVRGAIAGRE